MTRHEDLLLDAMAALPPIEPDPARAAHLRCRCHVNLVPREAPKRQPHRRIWQRFVRWSITLRHPLGQE